MSTHNICSCGEIRKNITKLLLNTCHAMSKLQITNLADEKQGPVVQSVVSLMSSLRVISLTVLADSIYNILVFFAEKM